MLKLQQYYSRNSIEMKVFRAQEENEDRHSKCETICIIDTAEGVTVIVYDPIPTIINLVYPMLVCVYPMLIRFIIFFAKAANKFSVE